MAKRTFRKVAKTPPYKNPSAPAARRVKDLLAHMTQEEKAPQMMCVWQGNGQKLVAARDNFEQRHL
jgi:hypothetical protein